MSPEQCVTDPQNVDTVVLAPVGTHRELCVTGLEQRTPGYLASLAINKRIITDQTMHWSDDRCFLPIVPFSLCF